MNDLSKLNNFDKFLESGRQTFDPKVRELLLQDPNARWVLGDPTTSDYVDKYGSIVASWAVLLLFIIVIAKFNKTVALRQWCSQKFIRCWLCSSLFWIIAFILFGHIFDWRNSFDSLVQYIELCLSIPILSLLGIYMFRWTTKRE